MWEVCRIPPPNSNSASCSLNMAPSNRLKSYPIAIPANRADSVLLKCLRPRRRKKPLPPSMDLHWMAEPWSSMKRGPKRSVRMAVGAARVEAAATAGSARCTGARPLKPAAFHPPALFILQSLLLHRPDKPETTSIVSTHQPQPCDSQEGDARRARRLSGDLTCEVGGDPSRDADQRSV